MKQVFLVILLVTILLGILYSLSVIVYPLIGIQKIISPIVLNTEKEPALERYAIENLRVCAHDSSDIQFTEMTEDEPYFQTYLFSYDPEGKKVTGQAHIPIDTENAPVIIMYRGYAELEDYVPGYGTAHSAEEYAKNGYITLAPDFLGYGGSDMPSENPMEERFQRYIAGLCLIKSVEKLNNSLESIETKTTADIGKVGFWGHSNGGHIALVMLEVTGKGYPTSLWNPVSKPFPYSILYYTDDYHDHGKALRKLLADFEEEYDAEKYSLTNYISWIKAPIILHQGATDELVPQKWSDDFVTLLEDNDVDVDYYVYPGNDHNFAQGAWNTVVQRDVRFFEREL